MKGSSIKIVIALLLVGVVVAITVLVIGKGKRNAGSNANPEINNNTSVQIPTATPEANKEELSKHQQEMNDGSTIMFMAGTISPEVLYVFPGQKIKILNHESRALFVTGVQESFEEVQIEKGKNGELVAPSAPGVYTFFDNSNPDLRGKLIVEE